MTQWVGGMGIIVLFVAVLPALAVAGRQMFFAEAPGPEEEALTPRIRHTAACALEALHRADRPRGRAARDVFGDMSLFDSVCHAHDDAGRRRVLAAPPFDRGVFGGGAVGHPAVHVPGRDVVRAAVPRAEPPAVLLRDTEFRTYALLLVTRGLVMAVVLAGNRRHTISNDSLRHGLFQSASIITTTGYASEDFDLWQEGALMVIFMLMFIGGCAGSAGGGPKVIRIVVLAKFLAREVLLTLHPRAHRRIRRRRPATGGRTSPVRSSGSSSPTWSCSPSSPCSRGSSKTT